MQGGADGTDEDAQDGPGDVRVAVQDARAAFRVSDTQVDWYDSVGFRVVWRAAGG